MRHFDWPSKSVLDATSLPKQQARQSTQTVNDLISILVCLAVLKFHLAKTKKLKAILAFAKLTLSGGGGLQYLTARRGVGTLTVGVTCEDVDTSNTVYASH
jgi:hypothetical protein|tara:strand:- start:13453 stop:13755 length:303 start_codon:yes stop_codon:yes gene_type:complete